MRRTAAALKLAPLIATALLAGGIGFATPALAQMGAPMSGPSPLGGGASPRSSEPAAPQPPPVPAIPGARPQGEAVAPPQRLASDMSPTEALFDAINRGDLAVARDAVARGADLEAKSLLGLTPLELSVDLGRNDISFMLLSMRGSTRGEHGPAVAGAAAPPPGPAPAASERRRLRREARQLAAEPAAAPAPLAPAAPIPAGGGTPVPAAGFLGFDIGRAGAR